MVTSLSHLSGDVLGRQQMFQLHVSLRERQVDGEPEEDDSAQQGETGRQVDRQVNSTSDLKSVVNAASV